MPKDPYPETSTQLKNAMLLRDVEYLEKRLHASERLSKFLFVSSIILLIVIVGIWK